MNNKELKSRVEELLKENGKLTVNEIAEYAGEEVALIQIHKVMSQLKQSGRVEEFSIDKVKYYESIQLVGESKQSKRDMTRYEFNGEKNLGKGRLALLVVRKYVVENNPTYKELKRIFPDSIVRPYGVVQHLSKARELSPDPKRKRYFLNDEDVIVLNRGQQRKVVVTNQWTPQRFLGLLAVADDLGYQVVSSKTS